MTKHFHFCPRGASRLRPWFQGQHYCLITVVMWKVSLSLTLIYVMGSSMACSPFHYFVNIYGVFFVIWTADKQANKVKHNLIGGRN